MNNVEAKEKILFILKNNLMGVIVGEFEAKYVGRASSTLPMGKRLILIKADKSIAIHENRLIRPTNYMINSIISCEEKVEEEEKKLVLVARKLNPRETITIKFNSVQEINSFDLPSSNDLRLSGSEKELNEALMDDLSFLEEGLIPINQQQQFRRGVCDIVAKDSKNRFVVIELKRRQADYNSVTQLKRYADEVQQLRGIETRGILLAPSIRKSALNLLKSYNLEFFSYDFEVGERSKIKGIGKSQTKLSDSFE